jgi:hypothetical protein
MSTCPIAAGADSADWRTGAGLVLSKFASMPHVLAGNLRLLAVTTAVHSDLLPTPTMDKFSRYEATTSWGISVPEIRQPRL